MRIFRFIVRGYPSSNHPLYHEWQKATLILFISANDPYSAEQKSMSELNQREWVAEAYDLKDILNEEAIRKEGGEILDAYLEALDTGVFWLENLDEPALTHKNKNVWGTGPQLNESFVDQLIIDSGGHRVTNDEAGNYEEKNADYVLGYYILELKHFEQEGLEVSTRQKKIAKIFDSYPSNNLSQKIDPYQLNEKDFQKYWDVVGVPVQKRIKAASKQVKSTKKRLGEDKYTGGVILLNTGYLTVPHKFLIEMAKRYAKKDTSSISEIIIISSWTITNGFDTVVNYGFHPHEPDNTEFKKLQEIFWETINKLLTQMVTEELDITTGMQKPMSPTYFKSKGKFYTFGLPVIESSFKNMGDQLINKFRSMMDIRIDNLDSNEVRLLLQEHSDEMLKYSPPESVHALDLAALKAPDVTFWTAWINGELAGCAALKILNENHAELKSMRTSHKFLRKGVAVKLLVHIINIVKTQSITKISLETGTNKAFVPAQKLYKGFGFRECQPFSNYKKDPYSMFLTKDIG